MDNKTCNPHKAPSFLFLTNITGNKQGNIPPPRPSTSCLIFWLLILLPNISKMRSDRSGANRQEPHLATQLHTYTRQNMQVQFSNWYNSWTLKSIGGKRGIKPIPSEGSCGRFSLSVKHYV